MNAYLKLLRPQQWIKNLFVFIPAFFAGKVWLLIESPKLILTFIAFCLIASAVYIFNDLRDLEYDRLHALKRQRPLATGAVPVRNAVALMIILAIASILIAFYISNNIPLIIGGYAVLNLIYSLGLKHFSLIDISFISIGFVLRVLAGGMAIDVTVSKWLVMMTFLLASCLALGKRRDDLLLDIEKEDLRPALKGYTLGFIDTCLVVLGVATIVCYIMYTVSEEVVQRLHSDNIYLTSVFVILGMLRFLQIAMVEENSGSPTDILLRDRFIQILIGLWLASFAFIIYVL
ncbi:decaprenyl-phosphate phosphoribosyltransferase [Leptolyngbya sp. 7M]|uniref:decaprenyl-phosphate phosphoribosyltransferase n=1 Tax=Leptolyngbya sp. 7M TaxID=2812896 RepID=UPI001B8C7C2F|nr:decaprenyl-phosphate phosphoribosyltransferase [Leptolyngbya sp. 7M]QYO65880.1 decaprenyl-phosphate phosphoribosyltransferase [Leptolyngbya sp. 7M]